jgi:hypothetical protein
MASKQHTLIQQEVDSWFPFRRGLRPYDRPAYDKLMEAGKALIADGFLKNRIIASEGLFMAGLVERQHQIKDIEAYVRDLRLRVEKLQRGKE